MKKLPKNLSPEIRGHADQLLTGLEQAYREIMALRNDPVRMQKRADALNAMCLKLKKQIEEARREQDAAYAETQVMVAAYKQRKAG